jgi:virulence-associated protein VagC
MEEMISVNTLPETLIRRFRSDRVRVHESNGVVTLTPVQESQEDSRAATTHQPSLWEEIKGLYGIIRSDIDEKAELAEARDEKYARFG